MTSVCPASLTGRRHVWMFDFDPTGALGFRCVFCQQWYAPP